MNKTIRKTGRQVLILLVSLIFTHFCAQAQMVTYSLDVKQSKLFWKGTKTVGSKHYGYLLFNSGWLRTNATGLFSDGMFTMNMKSIKSTEHKNEDKNKGIERELNGVAFFETSKYPTSTISVTSIMPTAIASQYKVEGNLTIKKNTHPIVFLATLKQNGKVLTANANLTIDREKWAIHQEKAESISDKFFAELKDKMVADEIPIVLRLVFTKK